MASSRAGLATPRLFALFHAALPRQLKCVFLIYVYFPWFCKIFSCERKEWGVMLLCSSCI